MNLSPRQHRLIELVHDRGGCSVEELARRLRVSDMTIRRDLSALVAAGRVSRTHGGASPTQRVSFEFRFLQRASLNESAKAAIGAAAAAMVRDGQSLLLDSGTTTLAIAQALRDRGQLRNLTLITTSLPIASALQFCDGVRVLLLGGYLRRESPDLVGPVTESNLERLRADLAFVGADAVDDRGRSYNADPTLARMLGQMVASARRAYCVADGSKLGGRALALIGDVSRWAGLITDTGAPAARLRELKHRGVHVVVAKPSSRNTGVRNAG